MRKEGASTATLCEHANALFLTAISGTQNTLSPEAVDKASACLLYTSPSMRAASIISVGIPSLNCFIRNTPNGQPTMGNMTAQIVL